MIVGSRALIRRGYHALLEREERIEVVAEAATGHRAVALAIDAHPDVVLLDAGLQDLDRVETTAAIVATGTAVMVMVDRETDDCVLGALDAGAAGVLSNDAEPHELICAMHVLAYGGALLPAGIMRRLLGEGPSKPHPSVRPHRLQELTDREREVMALAAIGLTNDEIAAQLVISPKTVKTHINRAMVKLDAHDRARLVVLAYDSGLVGVAPHDAPPPPASAEAASNNGSHRQGRSIPSAPGLA